MASTVICWSCGGGTQSAAIAALIVEGRLPRPDLALIVDTEREKASTWAYCEQVIAPGLAGAGVTLERVAKSDFAKVDLYSHQGALLIPAFSSLAGDGKLTNYCSGEWKRDVILRWLRSRGVQECETWVGISVDEMRRMRYSRVLWARNRYPLIEPEFGLAYRRSDCLAAVERAGWPPPPRSSCWMCPNQGNAEWREMKERFPEDFARAVAFERAMRERDPEAWLHSSRRPLDEVDFSAQASLFEDRACASGLCFT